MIAQAKEIFELGDSPIALKTLTHGIEINDNNWAEFLGRAASHNLSLSLKIEIIA